MPINYHIDFVEGIFEVSGSGRLTGEEIIEVLEKIFADKHWRPDVPQLWDSSAVTELDVDFSELMALRSMVLNVLYPDRMEWKWAAIVVQNRLTYTFIRVIQAMFSQSHARIFADRRAAVSWLQLAPSEGFPPVGGEISPSNFSDPHDEGQSEEER